MKKNVQKKDIMDKMVNLAHKMQRMLNNNSLKDFGELLDENWLLKREMATGVTSPVIDRWYSLAKKNGAEGGKILGAGGGGFLLLYAKKKYHDRILNSLKDLQSHDFKFEPQGSKIIFVSE